MNLCNLVAYRVLVRRSEGKILLGRTGLRWRHNIKLIFKEWNRKMDWNDLVENRGKWWSLVNSELNIRVP
jgi:hypothetical protein